MSFEGSFRNVSGADALTDPEYLTWRGTDNPLYLPLYPLMSATSPYYALPDDDEEVKELISEYGVDVFYIEGGVSDEHDETFFLCLICNYDALRSRVSSTDLTGKLEVGL